MVDFICDSEADTATLLRIVQEDEDCQSIFHFPAVEVFPRVSSWWTSSRISSWVVVSPTTTVVTHHLAVHLTLVRLVPIPHIAELLVSRPSLCLEVVSVGAEIRSFVWKLRARVRRHSTTATLSFEGGSRVKLLA